MGDSERDKNNKQGNSAASENQNEKEDKPREYDNSNVHEISNIKDLDDKDHEKPSDNEKNSEIKTPETPENSAKQKSIENSYENNSDNKDDSKGHMKNEDNVYHIPILLEHNLITAIKTNRDKIIKGSALIVGGFLILYGLVLVSASVTKVADNVIFGEDATADAFLILLGVLIIVAAFAQSIMDKTSLSKISSELEVNAKGSESDDDNSKKVKENDNNVNDDNKDNILGENKR
jgi:hypothetical protein